MIYIDYIQDKQICRINTDIIDRNWKQFRFYYNQLSDQSLFFEDSVELPWHAFILNLNLLVNILGVHGLNAEISPKAKQLIDISLRQRNDVLNVANLSPIPENEIQTQLNKLGFKRTLTKEQILNVSKLSRLKFGATFSVPGAGKTTEAISFYLLHRQEHQKLIVICPKNAFSAWEEQLSECFKSSPPTTIRLVNGLEKIANDLNNAKFDVFLISYQQYNLASNLIANYLHNNQSFVFVDESHRIKGGNKTETGRQIQKIAHLPIGKLIMSGTPLPQGEGDLLPQYSFLFPSDEAVDEKNVRQKIQSIYVRTTKNELLDPVDFPLNIIKTPIPLHEAQKFLYDLIRSEELRQVSGLATNERRIYRQLGKSYMRLLQVVSNPPLLLKSNYSFPDALREAIEYGPSNKITYAALKARQLAKEGKKVLIWSGFVENIESITQILADLGAKYIHGKVEAGSEEEENTRERIVKEFHDDPNMFVLVANPAACAEGISLHKVCHHAIYIDRNYNAAQYLQSMDRIHRLGLLKGTSTTIEILYSPSSIDDLINTRLLNKIDRMAQVLQDENLRQEPETVELDSEGFDDEDAKQILNHLKGLI